MSRAYIRDGVWSSYSSCTNKREGQGRIGETYHPSITEIYSTVSSPCLTFIYLFFFPIVYLIPGMHCARYRWKRFVSIGVYDDSILVVTEIFIGVTENGLCRSIYEFFVRCAPHTTGPSGVLVDSRDRRRRRRGTREKLSSQPVSYCCVSGALCLVPYVLYVFFCCILYDVSACRAAINVSDDKYRPMATDGRLGCSETRQAERQQIR